MTLDEAILGLVEQEEISDQSQLLRRLDAIDHCVTQPTLSRHLRKLGIQKIAGRYRSVDVAPAALPAFTLIEVSPCLLVIRTQPGYAQPLAVMLDQNELDGVAGTIAGDDTIFLAIRPEYQSLLPQLSRTVRGLLDGHGTTS